MSEYNVAVVGATGAVGREMINTLLQRKFPIKNLRLLASSRSAGTKLSVDGREIIVEELTENSFTDSHIHVALFSAGGSTSLKFSPIAARNKVIVIDNSSAWRMDKDVPLVVPEVNPEDVKKHKYIIANPNCSTIQMVVALKPLHDKARIKRIVVSTYQAVSGAGKKGMDDLENQVQAYAQGKEMKCSKFPYQIAFNCLPHIDVFLPGGYTKEEQKMVDETRKIMGDDSILVSPTAVRVPVMNGHSEAVNIETEKKITREEAMEILRNAPGVTLIDDVENNKYPMPYTVTGTDDVFVGRIREDKTIAHGLNLWIVADNLRKGAALNAVQIAEVLVQKNLI